MFILGRVLKNPSRWNSLSIRQKCKKHYQKSIKREENYNFQVITNKTFFTWAAFLKISSIIKRWFLGAWGPNPETGGILLPPAPVAWAYHKGCLQPCQELYHVCWACTRGTELQCPGVSMSQLTMLSVTTGKDFWDRMEWRHGECGTGKGEGKSGPGRGWEWQ